MISLSEIRNRALKFQKEWEGEKYERGEAQSFWNDFFQIFDVSRRRVATFEEPIKKLGGSQGFIDLFWKGQLLIEHKSLGKDLGRAKTQALDYFPNIPDRDLPKFILICDFQNFELYDLDENTEYHFRLDELHKNIEVFAFIAGYVKKAYKEEEPTNRAAAELMGRLHDKLLENGYEVHELELYLTRLLFCMFAEDTGIFPKNGFREFIDPACGSGNFLVIAYREIKLLEFEILKITKSLLPLIHIDQFYGFEIEELPSRITQTAMLLIDHQMNLRFAQMFGEPHFNIPIKESANIFNVNALRVDWADTLNGSGTSVPPNSSSSLGGVKTPLPKITIDYIIGNPPFLGYTLQSKEQKLDMELVFKD